jgi:hypothetical protein
MEDQPKPPQYICALRLEFDSDLDGPPILYRILARGTLVECKVIADRIPDVTYNGNRTIKNAAVGVWPAPELENQPQEDALP